MLKIKNMETKKRTVKQSISKNEKSNDCVKKSKIALFWEKYPNGIGEIIDMRAVLR
jgi:hypothetical protein